MNVKDIRGSHCILRSTGSKIMRSLYTMTASEKLYSYICLCIASYKSGAQEVLTRRKDYQFLYMSYCVMWVIDYGSGFLAAPAGGGSCKGEH